MCLKKTTFLTSILVFLPLALRAAPIYPHVLQEPPRDCSLALTIRETAMGAENWWAYHPNEGGHDYRYSSPQDFGTSYWRWFFRPQDEVYTKRISSTRIPLETWRTQTWTSASGRKYRAVNAGFSILRYDAQRNRDAFWEAQLEQPRKQLNLVNSGARRTAWDTLARWRWSAHQAVMDAYSKLKGYLSEQALSVLRVSDGTSEYSDVLMVLEERGDSLAELTPEQIQERLVATIQITAEGDADFISPQHFFNAPPVDPVPNPFHHLPFVLRAGSSKADTLKLITEKFGDKKLGEFTRYVKFRKELEPDIQAQLLLLALEHGHALGIQVFLLDADHITQHIFSRPMYGFKKLVDLNTLDFRVLPDGQVEHFPVGEPEVLMYLEAGSQEYVQTIQTLRSLAAGVQSTEIPFLQIQK